MKAAELIFSMVVIGVVAFVIISGKALQWTRKHFDHWHPAEPVVIDSSQIYRIEKYGCQSIEVAKFSVWDHQYDELVSQAESDCIMKCISMNSSQKTLRRYR